MPSQWLPVSYLDQLRRDQSIFLIFSSYRDNDVSYCYVTMQPHPGLDKFVTSTLECNTHLTVWETQTVTHIPLKFLSKQVYIYSTSNIGI